MEVIRPPLPICYPYLAYGQLPSSIIMCVQNLHGSAGSIPARQIVIQLSKPS
nr:MAG TPA: hypothetical protein [Caudoviricetes sp.]